jgi:hypothetical protein
MIGVIVILTIPFVLVGISPLFVTDDVQDIVMTEQS